MIKDNNTGKKAGKSATSKNQSSQAKKNTASTKKLGHYDSLKVTKDDPKKNK